MKSADRHELLQRLQAVFAAWDVYLAGRTAEQGVAIRARAGWSLRELVVHLWAWQQVSVARLEAARSGTLPEFPAWLGEWDPFFAEEHVDKFNARIQQACRDLPWPEVRDAWRAGFMRLIELGEQVPEDALFDTKRFAWLRGHSVAEVLEGSADHHREHLDALPGRFA